MKDTRELLRNIAYLRNQGIKTTPNELVKAIWEPILKSGIPLADSMKIDAALNILQHIGNNGAALAVQAGEMLREIKFDIENHKTKTSSASKYQASVDAIVRQDVQKAAATINHYIAEIAITVPPQEPKQEAKPNEEIHP